MRRAITRSTLAVATVLALFVAGCGGEKGGAAPEAKPTSAPAAANLAASAPAAASADPTLAGPGGAAGSPSAAASVAASAMLPADTPSAAAVPPGSAAATPKKFDCGAKGQTPCPMQGWMKRVMASASSSGDGEKLSAALTYVAAHVPPGFGTWAQIAKAGADKAKAGDIDGAKASCKQCHDAYKEKYKTTLRDRAF